MTVVHARAFFIDVGGARGADHPNVLSVYGIGRQGDAPYLVTELLDGVTVRQRLADGALPESKALEYADQLVQGLAAAHEESISQVLAHRLMDVEERGG